MTNWEMNSEAKANGPYTTLTVAEYNKLVAVITELRWVKQKARELLEVGKPEEAKAILKRTEEEHVPLEKREEGAAEGETD